MGGTYDDMVDMQKLNDAELMRNLRARFKAQSHSAKQECTTCGADLVPVSCRNCAVIVTVASR